jgi:tRNA dimethylallyltransferase
MKPLMILMNLKSMKKNTKKIILIIGPTAIGKTALSIELANALNTEIISCDSRQFYKELKIGAAPPNARELAATKHHFIQHLSVTDDYNAGEFEINAITKINELHKTKDTIIVVGGSGLYVDAICKGFDKMPEIPIQIRIKLNLKLNEKGIVWLQDEVKKVDPNFYASCDQQNPQRLLRALEVYIATGNTFSSFKSEKPKKRPFEIIKIGITTERETLYNRINTRVDKMLENGLLEEVELLIPFQHKNALQTVGYKEIFAFYNNDCTLEKSVENIKQNTRRFAKRQLTWFRKDKNTTWFEPNQINEIKTFIGL